MVWHFLVTWVQFNVFSRNKSHQKGKKNDSQNQANEFETEDIEDTVIADKNDNIGRCSDKSNPRFRGCTKYER